MSATTTLTLTAGMDLNGVARRTGRFPQLVDPRSGVNHPVRNYFRVSAPSSSDASGDAGSDGLCRESLAQDLGRGNLNRQLSAQLEDSYGGLPSSFLGLFWEYFQFVEPGTRDPHALTGVIDRHITESSPSALTAQRNGDR